MQKTHNQCLHCISISLPSSLSIAITGLNFLLHAAFLSETSVSVYGIYSVYDCAVSSIRDCLSHGSNASAESGNSVFCEFNEVTSGPSSANKLVVLL